MSKVLFLSIPSHGHVNPTLGLADELIKQGEEVTYFSSEEFRAKVESIGAEFKCFKEDLNIFKGGPGGGKGASSKRDSTGGAAGDSVGNPSGDSVGKDTPAIAKPKAGFGLLGSLLQPDKFIKDVLDQTKDQHFDYIIYSAAYPFASIIAKILNLPAISSYAVFATRQELFKGKESSFITPEITEAYKKVTQHVADTYHVTLPEDMLDLLFSKGEINIIYTSKYFVPHPEYYDDSYLFVGAPIYEKKGTVDFPFEKLQGKKVIYISLGTIFSNFSADINELFFKTFADMDAVIVMTAYNVDLSTANIPDNFIVRNYVPQSDVLKYTDVAITHSGMNSLGDIIYENVPFVSIPMGADQFYLANRAQELGATIVLDVNNLTPEILKDAVLKVMTDDAYLENIKKISGSFIAAGGYKRAVEEIFKLKQQRR